MHDRAAVLASLKADPTAAPIFADWFDEHDEPELAASLRSEFGPGAVAAWARREDSPDFPSVVRHVAESGRNGLISPGYTIISLPVPPKPAHASYAIPHPCYLPLSRFHGGSEDDRLVFLSREGFVLMKRSRTQPTVWLGACQACRVAYLTDPQLSAPGD